MLNISHVDLSSGSKLHSLFGDHCTRIERIYLLDNEPYIYFIHYVSLNLNQEEIKEVQINSLYRFLENQNVKLETFRDEFAVAIAPDHICETLKIENNSPVLKRIRISSDGDGNVMEYSEGYYNTAKQNYIVTYNEPVQ